MRWFVEASTIGDSAAPGRVCLEAAEWQEALEAARRKFKDGEPLSCFSIEALDEGYRAVDVARRRRYVVRRAPEGAELSASEAPHPSTIPSPPGGSFRTQTTLPAPGSTAPSLTVPSDSTPPAPPAPAPAASAQRRPAPVSDPIERLQVAETSQAAVQPSRELSRRLEPPTAQSPLLYCEVAYVVGVGLARAEVERILLQRFGEVCGTLEAHAAPKFVQLAVFDHQFAGRPERLPLATLAWKDWRGVPVVAFPLFGEPTPVPSSLPPSAPSWSTSDSAPPSAPPHSSPESSTSPKPAGDPR
jgi:hypothetical protein